MARIQVGATAGGPFTSIECPDGAEPANADDIQRVAGGALGNDAVRAQEIAAGAAALTAYINEANGKFIVGNGVGKSYTPTGDDPIYIGGTGFGGIVGAPLAAHPSQATGIRIDSRIDAREGLDLREGIRLLGGDPAVDTDVGADNRFFAANVPKAWAEYDVLDDADDDEIRLKTGINVDSTVTSGNVVTVTFVRPMSQPYYHVDLRLTFNITTGGPEIFQYDIISKTDAGFKVSLYRLNLSTGASSTIGVTWGAGKGFSFAVNARQ